MSTHHVSVKSVGKRIRLRRKEHQLTQAKFAQLIGRSEIMVWRYETGEMEPSMSTLGRMAVALQVSLDWLVFGHSRQTVRLREEAA
jgi:transcriptional regulator with XRE-family HTH domain